MARTRQHEPVADSSKKILAVWAVVGPTVGMIIGLLLGYAAWGGKAPAPPGPNGETSRRPAIPGRPQGPGTSRTAKGPANGRSEPAAEPARTVRKSPRRVTPKTWLEGRGLPQPQLAYYFSERPTTMLALANKLTDGRCRLRSSGPVRATSAGAVFSDGGKLMSKDAGAALSAKFRASGIFSVEALVRPADTRHRGPARIVSLSYDGGVRNFTLAQEGAHWSVRLRTTSNDLNGCKPQITVGGLSAKWTHVVVTYDGSAERVYLDGRLAKTARGVTGPLGNWETTKYPLVLGNEAYEARNWAGTVKFVIFYDRALTAGQIRKAADSLPPVANGKSSDAGGDVF